MSERSSLHKLVVAAALVSGACGGKKANAPEADPAVAKDVATRLLGAMPSPSATRECTDADVMGVPSITYRSLLSLAGRPTPDTEATLKPWVNPPELDAPAVRTLLDASANETAKRRAAAQLERAKAVIIYRIDYVNAPLALAVKHPIRGTVHARTIRFDNGRPTCVALVSFQEDKEKSDWAIARSDKPIVDPEVAKALQDDLTVQWLAVAPGHVQAAAPKK
jgi:hypothetical protein